MRKTLAAALLCSVATFGSVEAHQYKPNTFACQPTLELWERYHGPKVREVVASVGVHSERVIRWDSGTLVRATIGPAIDPETGENAICVVADLFLGREETAAAN